MAIREAQEEDLPRLLNIYNHYVEHTSITFDIDRVSLAARKLWFEDFDPLGPHRLYVAESESRVHGYASSRVFRAKAAYAQSVETSIYLAPESTGSGFGAALYSHLITALEAHPEVHRALGGVTLPNESSVALHSKMGFTEIGRFSDVGFKFGQHWDVAWFERAV